MSITLPIPLSVGAHDSFAQGACLLEMTAYLAGEGHSDHPVCVSPVLAAFGRALNDGLFAAHLEELAPYAAKLIGTNVPESEQRRTSRIADFAVRVAAPIALDAAGLGGEAQTLRGLPALVDIDAARAAADAAAYAADAAHAAHAADAARAAARAAAYAADAAAHAAGTAADAGPLRQSVLRLLDELVAMDIVAEPEERS